MYVPEGPFPELEKQWEYSLATLPGQKHHGIQDQALSLVCPAVSCPGDHLGLGGPASGLRSCEGLGWALAGGTGGKGIQAGDPFLAPPSLRPAHSVWDVGAREPAKLMVINTQACLHSHLQSGLGHQLQVQGRTVGSRTAARNAEMGLQPLQGWPTQWRTWRENLRDCTPPSAHVWCRQTPMLQLPLSSQALVLTRQPQTA